MKYIYEMTAILHEDKEGLGVSRLQNVYWNNQIWWLDVSWEIIKILLAGDKMYLNDPYVVKDLKLNYLLFQVICIFNKFVKNLIWHWCIWWWGSFWKLVKFFNNYVHFKISSSFLLMAFYFCWMVCFSIMIVG